MSASERNLDRVADLSRVLHHSDTGCLKALHLLGSRALSTGNDGAGMAHTPPWRRRDSGDEADHRLFHVLLYELRGFLFSIAADLADHYDRMSLGVLLEQRQYIDEACAINRIATDTNTRRST